MIADSYSNDNLNFLNKLLLHVSIVWRHILNCTTKCNLICPLQLLEHLEFYGNLIEIFPKG